MEDGTIIAIVFSLVFFVVTFLFVLLPSKCKSLRENITLNCLANCFSGGIFMSIALVHLMPAAVAEFEEGCGGHCGYPFPYFLTLIGYKLILWIERVKKVDELHGHEEGQHEARPVQPQNGEREALDETNGVKNGHQKVTPAATEKAGHVDADKSFKSPSPIVICVALSVHGVFEGIAIGLVHGVGSVLQLIFAIMIHKIAASVALGINIGKMMEPTSKMIYALTLIFSFATPLGIVLGVLIKENSNAYVSGIFLALSVGTFLYIAASEVIAEEFSSSYKKGAKFTAYFVGIATISLLMLWHPEEEGHDH